MEDHVHDHSGSRWEPGAGSAPPSEPADQAAVRRPGRRAVLVAVVAVALLLVGGAGGFAIGRSTAGGSGPSVRTGFDGHRHRPGDIGGDRYGGGPRDGEPGLQNGQENGQNGEAGA